jgi:hypothetical protein
MSADPTGTALLLDGREDDDATLGLIHDRLCEALEARGYAVDDWALREERMAPCAGCFGCWVKTPGVCVHADAGRDVAPRVARAGLLVYLTPVTFGSYSAELKKALDHIVPLTLPYLKKTGADTRHPERYDLVRDLLVLGTVPAGQANGAEAATFRRLVARNVLNTRPRRWAVGMLETGMGEAQVRPALAALFEELGARPLPAATLEAKEAVA